MTANTEQYAAAEELRKLREELQKAKGWEEAKQRYRLFQGQGTNGSVVYALLESKKQEGEPAHYLCANCYEQGRRSILNNSLSTTGFTNWLCPNCKAQFPTGYRGGVTPRFAAE